MYANLHYSRETRVTVKSLNLHRQAHLPNQYLRPNTITPNGSVYQQLSNLMVNYRIGEKTNKIPTTEIARLTSDFMLPSSNVETATTPNGGHTPVNVVIPNGWNEERFIFFLVVEVTCNGTTTIEYITGYTNCKDTTRLQGMVNGIGHAFVSPDTVFHINNITTLGQSSSGQMLIKDSLSVYGGKLTHGVYDGHTALRMTPYELFKSADISVTDGLSTFGNYRVITHDSRDISAIPALAKREYNSPSAITTGLIGSFIDSVSIANGQYDSFEDITNKARSSINDPNVLSSRFMSKLSMDYRSHDSSFTYKWLSGLDPALDQKTIINANTARTGNNSSDWVNPTLEAQMALVVSTMLTTLLTSCSLASVSFTSTNMVSSLTPVQMTTGLNYKGQRIDTRINNITNISGTDCSYLIQALENTLNSEMIPVVSYNGMRDYRLMVNAYINGMVEVHISFGQNPMEFFEFPSFADALISPIVTTNKRLFSENSRDIGTLLDDVRNHLDGWNQAPIDPINQPMMHPPMVGQPPVQQPMQTTVPIQQPNPITTW